MEYGDFSGTPLPLRVSLEEQVKAVDDQVQRVRKATAVGTPDAVRAAEASILNAESSRELALLAERLVEGLNAGIRKGADTIDGGTRLVARWTKWLVFATVLLALATASLVLVEWHAEPRLPEVIVVPSPTPPSVVLPVPSSVEPQVITVAPPVPQSPSVPSSTPRK